MSKYLLSALVGVTCVGAAWQLCQAPTSQGAARGRAAAAAARSAETAAASWQPLSGTVSSVDVARGRLWLIPDPLQPLPAKEIAQLRIDQATQLLHRDRALAWRWLHAGDRVTVWYQPTPARRAYVRSVELMTAPGLG